MDCTVYNCHDVDIHLQNTYNGLIPFLDMESPEEGPVPAAAECMVLDDFASCMQLGLPGASLSSTPEEWVDAVDLYDQEFAMEAEGCCYQDRHHSIGFHEQIHLLEKSSPPTPAGDCPADADIDVTVTVANRRNEWAAWIQLALPGDSLLTHDGHADGDLLSHDGVWSGYEPDEGSPQHLEYSPTPLDGRNLYGSLDDHDPLIYSAPGSQPWPVTHAQVPVEVAFFGDCSSGEEARTDSEPEPERKDYMHLSVSSSPEPSPVSSPSDSLPDTLQDALEDATQPVSEASPPEGLLAVQLMKHQRIALSWMLQKETCTGACAGGILADDQGLGKTLSTIALIVSEKRPRPAGKGFEEEEEELDFLVSHENDEDSDQVDAVGPHLTCRKRCRTSSKSDTAGALPSLPRVRRPAGGTLVVCPTSVLRQWADEIRNKVTSQANLSFLVYYGPNRTGDPRELARYDVVLTTYHVVSMEVPKEVLGDGNDVINDNEDWLNGYDSIPRPQANSSPSNKKRRKNPRGNTLAMVAWFRVVLDEAQTIKNHKTRAARACSRLVAKRRWCLSGTPIQNSINDLYSYFRFLRHETYSAISSFRDDIRLPIERKLGNPVHGYQKLQEVLKGVLLRRTKETLIEGHPIVNLPPKSLEMNVLDFSEKERAFYNDLESASQKQFKEYQDNGTVKQNFVNILQLLLRLRQACNHPNLIPAGFESSPSQALCVVCSDLPEDAVVSVCGHVFCKECVLKRLSSYDAEDKTCPKLDCKRKITVETQASLKGCTGDVQLVPETSFERTSSTVNGSEQQPGDSNADSSKIKAAMDMLKSLPKLEHSSSSGDERPIASGQATEKALVFSQWTKMLDQLEKKLSTSSIQYRRLDGTMPIADRDRVVQEFNTNPKVTVMLMSLKAASVGLNMVAANHVLLLDPWWNPTTEEQAIDRAHRIGQKRPVKVTRFTVKDTVEDRIMNLQERKRRLVASAFGEVGKGSRQSTLTEDDLSYLFKA